MSRDGKKRKTKIDIDDGSGTPSGFPATDAGHGDGSQATDGGACEPTAKPAVDKGDKSAGAPDVAASDGAKDDSTIANEQDSTIEEQAEAIVDEAANEINELEKAKSDAADMRDKYLRLQAEWDNFRKRTAQERADERARAAERLVRELLPVVDDLERAVAAADDSVKEGIQAIATKMASVLDKEGVKSIEALDQPFDADKHNAVSTREDTSVPNETVVEVYQKGYTMGEKVIRPAMVVTSTGGPAEASK
jgi:molecular chaperone GrpE